MSVAKDPKTGKWYSKFRYTDWTGKRVQKKKTGFITKREAQEWEREFLTKAAASCDMSFASLVELYMADCKTRLRATTWENKQHLITKKLLPYFGSTPINQITPLMIRNWQNTLMELRQPNGKPYSKTYLKTINNQVAAILNYAVKYYGLPGSPAAVAGSMGKSKADTMLFWTEDEFKTFIQAIDKPTPYCAFNVLFYTGIREGELLALSLSDFDFTNQVLHITKNFAVANGREVIYEPKTPKSKRDITLPDFLCAIVQDYAGRLLEYDPDDRLFPFTKSWTPNSVPAVKNPASRKFVCMISVILTPACSFTWAFLSWPCRSAWGTKRYKPPWSYMAICTRTCMAMWPSSFRTVPPLICLRQHGKMHKKAYNFGMWYTSGTLRQNKSPETLIFQWFPGFLQLFKLDFDNLPYAEK